MDEMEFAAEEPGTGTEGIEEVSEQIIDDVEADVEANVDYNMNSLDTVDLTEDFEATPKKAKYIHEKLVRKIKPIIKLEEKDFKNLVFTGKDLKALKLMIELGAVKASLASLMQSFAVTVRKCATVPKL
jgi:hypothetical protein